MTEPDFWKKFLISRYSRNFLDFVLLVFLDFPHNERWACLVVFLQFAGPVSVSLFYLSIYYCNVYYKCSPIQVSKEHIRAIFFLSVCCFYCPKEKWLTFALNTPPYRCFVVFLFQWNSGNVNVILELVSFISWSDKGRMLSLWKEDLARSKWQKRFCEALFLSIRLLDSGADPTNPRYCSSDRGTLSAGSIKWSTYFYWQGKSSPFQSGWLDLLFSSSGLTHFDPALHFI